MPRSLSSQKAASRFKLYFGLAVALLFFAASGLISYINTKNLKESVIRTARTHDTLMALHDLVSTMKDAETGQRGYVLTGRPEYLEPYKMAVESIGEKIDVLDDLNDLEEIELEQIQQVKRNVAAKFKEIQLVIDIYRNRGQAAAIKKIAQDDGKDLMDAIRNDVNAMKAQEQHTRLVNMRERERAYSTTIVSGIFTAASGVALAILVTILLARVMRRREREDWIRNGQAGISAALLGDQTINDLGPSILSFFADYFGAHGGAFFVRSGDGFKRVSTYGVPEGSDVPTHFGADDGLLGQAVKSKKAFIVRNVPDGYMMIGSALGRDKPRHLIITPSIVDNAANSVIELGFIDDLDEAALELLDDSAEAIGVAVRAADYRAHLQNLLEETQRQSEELQSQSEELRVSNEELEEQSRALKESQARLEQQQIELEQTNTQLEEQTQQLESQKDELEKTNVQVISKAKELEQASQYKSDFLANMSHELRTPLNSSLILAKLLADNPQGNLSEEQVKFAQTIQSAGNDLLTLINDILDLSKIESGHMEINADHMRIFFA